MGSTAPQTQFYYRYGSQLIRIYSFWPDPFTVDPLSMWPQLSKLISIHSSIYAHNHRRQSNMWHWNHTQNHAKFRNLMPNTQKRETLFFFLKTTKKNSRLVRVFKLHTLKTYFMNHTRHIKSSQSCIFVTTRIQRRILKKIVNSETKNYSQRHNPNSKVKTGCNNKDRL